MNDDQMDLFGMTPPLEERPAVARNTDPETSHEAAESISIGSIQMTQLHVLHCLDEHGPQIDNWIFAWFDSNVDYTVSPSGLRTRRSELVRRGLVRHSGGYAQLPSGRRARVWEITEAGQRLIRCCDMRR